MDANDVIVGVDGSDSSGTALRWAATEARRGGGRLRIVLAYRWRPGARLLVSDEAAQVADDQAGAIVDRAVAAAREAVPDVAVDGTAVVASPASALLDAAGEARLVVVGSRGRGGFASLLLGSVGLAVATHAPCPVAVVRGKPDTVTGPVVVGLTDADQSALSLGYAFEHAAGHGGTVVAAHVHGTPVPRAGLRDELLGAIALWHDKYPQVRAELVLVPGHPGEVLIGLSRGAHLVVVGARGLGGFAGLLLGSTSQHLIHHAHCPVLITRARAT